MCYKQNQDSIKNKIQKFHIVRMNNNGEKIMTTQHKTYSQYA